MKASTTRRIHPTNQTGLNRSQGIVTSSIIYQIEPGLR